jgi:hypothetical protein
MKCALRNVTGQRVALHSIMLAITVTLAACGGSDNDTPARSVGSLRFIGEQRIGFKQAFQATTVGGLSGIDYSPKTNAWIMQSDDRSDINPARFYTANLTYDAQGFSSVTLNAVTTFKQQNGTVYPSRTQYATLGGEVPDTEAVRFDPEDGSVWYTSEGDRSLGLDPFVKHATLGGDYVSRLPLPAIFKVSSTIEAGSRNNLTFEGLTFAPDGKSLWVSMEAPVYQDGAVPTTTAGALSRITHYDRNGAVIKQVAYPIDAIPVAPASGMAADNGVSEILAVDDNRLLVIERSGVQGADGNYKDYIRLYEMDTSAASDVGALPTLQGTKFTAATKRLVLDLTTLNLPKLDNIEGIAWGPKLANGHDSLVLVSDDNFNATQVTQFLAFEVMPR